MLVLSTKSFNGITGVKSIKLNKNPIVLRLNLKSQAEFIVSPLVKKKNTHTHTHTHNKIFLTLSIERTFRNND